MDSWSVSPTHGEQEKTASGTAITPAPATIRCFCSTSSAIWNAARYVPATCTGADGWESVFKPVIVFGIRARFCVSTSEEPMQPSPCREFHYECLEAERVKYAIRIPTNQVLQNRIGYLLKRPKSDDRRTRSGGTTPISPIRRQAGPSRAG